MIKAGIIGGAGYTGGEVMRLLLQHPEVELSYVQSESQDGKKVTHVHRDCYGMTDLSFEKVPEANADVVFLCKGHGESRKFLDNNPLPGNTKVIDLSQDFRHRDKQKHETRTFVYGLPEMNKKNISVASSVANPGCFATCIQLALLPLAVSKGITSEISVCATTGSTGAGQAFSDSSHFSWRSNNHGAYKLMNHQHETEIRESIGALHGTDVELNFIPQRGAFTRGIYSVTYIKGDHDPEKVRHDYMTYYKDHPFVHVVPFDIDVKQVVNTNNCFLNIHKEKNKLIIVSAIDNLLKGAAGQAVQNMNLLFGMNETSGLKLKPAAF